jgi:hypothetical protein
VSFSMNFGILVFGGGGVIKFRYEYLTVTVINTTKCLHVSNNYIVILRPFEHTISKLELQILFWVRKELSISVTQCYVNTFLKQLKTAG